MTGHYHLIKAIEDNYNSKRQTIGRRRREHSKLFQRHLLCKRTIEVNPYWRGLWRRKIDLYRKQGNDVEADRLLKRINQIYQRHHFKKRLYLQHGTGISAHMKKAVTGKKLSTPWPNWSRRHRETNNTIWILSICNCKRKSGSSFRMGFQRFVEYRQLFFNKQKVGILGELTRYPEALVSCAIRWEKQQCSFTAIIQPHPF